MYDPQQGNQGGYQPGGFPPGNQPGGYGNLPVGPDGKPFGADKKLPAGICAILLGWLGIHKFILGYQTEGIIMLVVGIVGWFLCGIPTLVVSIIGIVEGIMYLTKSDQEFVQTYIHNKKPWF